MNRRFLLLLSVALGLGLVIALMMVTSVAGDPIPGKKIQIPRIDVGDIYGTGDWETLIQVQNVGEKDTGAIMFVWGEYSELCPTNDPGPIAHYCMLIRENALWTLKRQLIPEAKSAIVYSVGDADGDGEVEDDFQLACQLADHLEEPRYSAVPTVNWRMWKEDWENATVNGITNVITMGEPLAVVVNREGPNEYSTTVSSAYVGISEEMEGTDPPSYLYHAPYLMKGFNDLDTELTIQNSGQNCTSIWIDYMEQGSCIIIHAQHIEALAPGEAIRVKVPCDVGEIQCPWLGAARISSHEPLGIIIDQTSFITPCGSVDRGTLLTSRARPRFEVRYTDAITKPITDTVFYADLLYREWSGWTSSIQVQNLSPANKLTFVTVDFMDASGDEITFLGDWVCPIGSTTFYIPAINGLPKDYVGAAEIQSHKQISYPGLETYAEPIFVIVDLKKTKVYDEGTQQWKKAEAGEVQGGSYNAHPLSQKEWHDWREVDIALPFLGKMAQGKWTSLIALRNNSNCTKIRPYIELKDETGSVVCYVGPFWLRPKNVKLIDLAEIGCIVPQWIGAGRVKLWGPDREPGAPLPVEQLCDVDGDGRVDHQPIMPSVVVVEQGTGAGDITKIYEGIPVSYTDMQVCYGGVYGYVLDDNTNLPLGGVTVTVGSGVEAQSDTTDDRGDYEVTHVRSGSQPFTATLDGYLTYLDTITVPCCSRLEKNFKLRCNTNTVTGTVVVSDTGFVLPGATVIITYTPPYTTPVTQVMTTTNGSGNFSINNLPKQHANETLTITISAAGYDTWGPHTHTFTECGQTINVSSTITHTIMCPFGTITGVISDTATGQGVAGATVRAIRNTTVVTTTTSGADGSYSLVVSTGFGSPPYGTPYTYKVQAEKVGKPITETATFQFSKCGETITKNLYW